MNLKFLKPRLVNVILTLAVLVLPIFQERVPLSLTGPYVIERYSPISMLIGYISLGYTYPLLQMLGFSLFAYIAVSMVIQLLNVSIDFFKFTSTRKS